MFEHVEPGEYTVSVEDEEGCSAAVQVDVTTDVAFSDVRPILDTSCATSACHDGSVDGVPDFTVDNTVIANASNIRTFVRDFDPSLVVVHSFTRSEAESIA